MIDPGAIGTVLIGRRAAPEGLDEERRPSASSRSPSSVRGSVRAVLRRALRLIPNRGVPAEPTPVAAGSGD